MRASRGKATTSNTLQAGCQDITYLGSNGKRQAGCDTEAEQRHSFHARSVQLCIGPAYQWVWF